MTGDINLPAYNSQWNRMKDLLKHMIRLPEFPIIMKRREFIKSTFALSAIGSCLPTYLLGSNRRFNLEIQILAQIK